MSEFDDVSAILNPEPEVAEDEVVEDSAEDVEIDEEVAEDVESVEDEGSEVSEFDLDDFNVKQLSEEIGVEASDLYNMKISLSDEADPVTLGSIKDTFQEVNREKTNLEKQLNEQSQYIEQAKQSVGMQQQVSNDMLMAQAEMQNIQAQFENINWADEESIDPGNAALMRQKMNERYNAAQNKMGQIQQFQQQQQQQYMANAHHKMYEMIPEWSDASTKRDDQDLIRKSLNKNGFNDNEINSISDPRLLVLARKLARYENSEVETKELVKKARKAPKMLRGKNGRFKKSDGQQHENIISKFKQGKGGKQSELAAAKALLFGK